MNHTSSHETAKNLQRSKDTGKNPQELYDKYIRKGDEAIIAEDIILAEKYYQYADHYLRLMNDPNHCGNEHKIQHPAFPHLVEESIAKALKGILAERAARKAVTKEKTIESVKAVKLQKKDKTAKDKTTQRKASQAKGARKKSRDKDEPCKNNIFKAMGPCAGIEKQNQEKYSCIRCPEIATLELDQVGLLVATKISPLPPLPATLRP